MQVMEQLYMRLDRTVKALQANRMDACWVRTKEDALQKVAELIPAGATAACGGSMTLSECGIMEWLRSGHCRFLDREAVPREEVPAIYRAAFSSDVYLMSSNAVTENGELYNVDGNGNRVAALIYGPESVIVVAGANKLVPDIPAAVRRVKSLAAPVNAARLKQDTPCGKCGTCAGLRGDVAAGCRSEQRICCSYVVSGYQRVPGRIKVILVAETLGY
ncbi:MAG: lactate utilization protein [Oscillospiraceae bacterium]|nr:lactate utilization protein [Oscillospiraceae bacterium]